MSTLQRGTYSGLDTHGKRGTCTPAPYRASASVVFALLAGVSVTACQFATGGYRSAEELKEVESQIKQEMGIETHVRYQRAVTSSSGSKKLVVVEFGSTPPGSIAEVRRHVEAIVARSFEGGVDHITLVF